MSGFQLLCVLNCSIFILFLLIFLQLLKMARFDYLCIS